MADLIDRDALLERIDAKFFATDPKGEEQLGYLNSRTLVRTAPAVDAVEVVRCKDCKHRHIDKDFASGKYCSKRWANGGRFCEDDDFCSYGERRTDATD